MTAWAQLLHFYQPPTQTHDILRKIADESYRPVVGVLLRHPAARISVNMNGVLTEMLHDHGMGDILAGLRELHERGQVEIVGSGKYHPILPLIPPDQRLRSITEHAATNAALLGAPERPAGFFPPELCWSAELADMLRECGARWVLLSGVANTGAWPTADVARMGDAAGALSVLFRDDMLSNRISFRATGAAHFVDDLRERGREGAAYVVTAMDAETFGHHLKGWEHEFLEAAYERIEAQKEGEDAVRMLTLSEVVGTFPPGAVLDPHASSWSTSNEDIAAGNPYPLWDSPGNGLHRMQWEMVGRCLSIVELARLHAGEPAGQLAAELQPALHSCQFWWASRRPMWSPPMVHCGFRLLDDVMLFGVRALLDGDAPVDAREQALAHLTAAHALREQVERILFLEGFTEGAP